MNITATEGASLIGARTESAASVRLHAPGAATRPVAEITLPPAKVVALAPGQYRLMLLRLDKRVRLGDIVHLVLTIRDERGIRDIPVGAVARCRRPAWPPIRTRAPTCATFPSDARNSMTIRSCRHRITPLSPPARSAMSARFL